MKYLLLLLSLLLCSACYHVTSPKSYDSDTLDSDTLDSDTLDSDTLDSDTLDSDTLDSDTLDSDTLDSDTLDSDTLDSDTLDSDTLDSDTLDSDTLDSDTLDLDTEPCYQGDLVITTYADMTAITNKTCIEGNLTVSSKTMTNVYGLQQITFVTGDVLIGSISNADDGVLKMKSLTGLEGLIRIDGSLTIGYADELQNLDGLSNLTKIGDNLNIKYATALTSLEGLAGITALPGGWLNVWGVPNVSDLSAFLNLTSVRDGIFIGPMDKLTDLNGLQNVTGATSAIAIYNCPLLKTLSGLNGITTLVPFLTEDWSPSIEISNNNALTDLSALSNITITVDNLAIKIHNNDALTDLSWLPNITGSIGSLSIKGNSSLSNLVGLEGVTSTTDSIELEKTALTSLIGLDNITAIEGSLGVYDNPVLKNFTGLKRLESIGRIFQIKNNDGLIDFSGLNNLKLIGDLLSPYYFQDLYIGDNDSLESLNGLEKLAFIGDSFQIWNNPLLTSILELESLIRTTYINAFSENPSLDKCQQCTLNNQLTTPIKSMTTWCTANCPL
ncbi:MAG: hypothetical protein JXR91_01190 [Deltaproteobacteria bacterium]|nr:hypothetical protein [Deltaproteobacteria bacterium]